MLEMPSNAIYALEDVSKVYGGREVLRVERLDVRRGEVLAIVGPSGAGKSTLLRLLNFLEVPTSGVILFQGATFSPRQEIEMRLRRRVTTVFQRPLLLNRSVSANVGYGLRLRGRRKADQAVDEALEKVGLAELHSQSARTLSGGEAQRAALARALVLEPDVLLLDEPTANLDPFNVKQIEDIVIGLNEDNKTTIILVTHNIFQARRLASRVVLMLDGEIVEIADRDTFFESPRDERTAAFTSGEMVF